MTVNNEPENMDEFIDTVKIMEENNEQEQSMLTNNPQADSIHEIFYEPPSYENDIDINAPSVFSNDVNKPFVNILHLSDYEPYNRIYLEDWVRVEHLFGRFNPNEEMMNNLRPSPPTPPPPMAFRINNDLFGDEPVEEDNIDDLVNSLNNIRMIQPVSNFESDRKNQKNVEANLYDTPSSSAAEDSSSSDDEISPSRKMEHNLAYAL